MPKIFAPGQMVWRVDLIGNVIEEVEIVKCDGDSGGNALYKIKNSYKTSDEHLFGRISDVTNFVLTEILRLAGEAAKAAEAAKKLAEQLDKVRYGR